MVRVIICGILGRMGTRLMETLFESGDMEVVCGIDLGDGVLAGLPIHSDFSECDQPADVVIDFSNPALTADLTAFCRRRRLPLVLCTTGQEEKHLEMIRRLSSDVPVFLSSNMSLGVALLTALAKKAAVALQQDFDIEIIERHHNRKLDAPSGTAMMLAKEINSVSAGRYDFVYDRHDHARSRAKNEIGLHAVRGGSIVGDHEILFAGNDEVLTLSHSAASRNVFAVGAINAARFIIKQPPGLYNMDALMRSIF